MSSNEDTGEAAAAVTAAEAELKAAQEKLAAAKARLSDEPAETSHDSIGDDADVSGDADATDAEPADPAAEMGTESTAPAAEPTEQPVNPAAETTVDQSGWTPYSTGEQPAPSATTPPVTPRSPDQEPGGTVPPQQPHYGYQQPYSRQSYPQQPYGQQQYTQPVVSTKDHVAAGLLAIFLGGFGVHKFYLGYNVPGFIMLAVTVLGSLLTFGLAAAVVWVISIIEGILYLTKSQSEFEQIYVFNKHEWF